MSHPQCDTARMITTESIMLCAGVAIFLCAAVLASVMWRLEHPVERRTGDLLDR